MNGVLVIDKPTGVSSAQALERVRRTLKIRRAGHGGTLDPIATGVLPILLGEATKLAEYLLADDKEYEVEARLGIETDTLDRAGQIVATHEVHVTREQLVAALAARSGEQDQVPPMYSAIKHAGVELYKRARRGEHVERAPRRVRIDRLELLAFEGARVTLAIGCSKGTYVRSLVADLGRDLGCGAHVSELRRTRSGRFDLAIAQPIDALDPSRLVGMTDALPLPVVRVADELVPKLRSGVQLPVDEVSTVLGSGERFQMVTRGGELVAIAHADAGRIVYDRVFKAWLAADDVPSP
ncbi:MAG: tRNA pseudouridine(55) synthase TruB [Acidobacteriota bacterium]